MNTSRRQAIRSALLTSASLTLPSSLSAAIKALPRSLKFGIITDLHLGFIPDAPKRFAAFKKAMKELRPDSVIQMGDFAYPQERHQKYVDAFNALSKHPVHAIGNHELDHRLTREDARKSWGIPSFYYCKEVEGVRVLVLDGNDRGSPTYKSHGGYHSYIGKEQQEWLAKELKEADQPALIVSHQPLAGSGAVDNAKEMQALLAPHKNKILLCINGHSHIDLHLEIDGVNYLHLNSASYFWLGGKVRTAFYRDPLFTTMTLDHTEGRITFSACKSAWSNGSPEDVGYFEKNEKRKGLKEHIVPRISAREFRPGVLRIE
jgi:hypothetical protein